MPSSAHVHKVLGRRVRVCDTVRTFRRVMRALQDEELDTREREIVVLRLVYADPDAVARAFGPDLHEAIQETLWDCFGIDVTGERPNDGKKAFDLDEDRARIIVTVREAYGMDWDALEDTPYKEACALLLMAPHDTPMGQAVYYRLGKPPKRTKYNGKEISAWREAAEAYRLRGTGDAEDATERANNEASSAFEAMKRRALASRG